MPRKKEIPTVRLDKQALEEALAASDSALLHEMASLVWDDSTDSDIKIAQRKIKMIARKLKIALLTIAPVRKSATGSSRLPTADRCAQGWRTLDMVRRAIYAEKSGRLHLGGMVEPVDPDSVRDSCDVHTVPTGFDPTVDEGDMHPGSATCFGNESLSYSRSGSTLSNRRNRRNPLGVLLSPGERLPLLPGLIEEGAEKSE